MDETNDALIHLAEECSEVIKEIMKIERFGLDTTRPSKSKKHRILLLEEIEDVERQIVKVRKLLNEEK